MWAFQFVFPTLSPLLSPSSLFPLNNAIQRDGLFSPSSSQSVSPPTKFMCADSYSYRYRYIDIAEQPELGRTPIIPQPGGQGGVRRCRGSAGDVGGWSSRGRSRGKLALRASSVPASLAQVTWGCQGGQRGQLQEECPVVCVWRYPHTPKGWKAEIKAAKIGMGWAWKGWAGGRIGCSTSKALHCGVLRVERGLPTQPLPGEGDQEGVMSIRALSRRPPASENEGLFLQKNTLQKKIKIKMHFFCSQKE